MLQVYVTSANNLLSGQRNEPLNSNASCYVRVTAIGCNGRQQIIGYTDISSRKGQNQLFDINCCRPFKVPYVAASKVKFDVILGRIKINGLQNENSNLISTATIEAKPFNSSDEQKVQLGRPGLTETSENEKESKHRFVKISTGYDQNFNMGTLSIVIKPQMQPFEKIVTHKHSF